MSLERKPGRKRSYIAGACNLDSREFTTVSTLRAFKRGLAKLRERILKELGERSVAGSFLVGNVINVVK